MNDFLKIGEFAIKRAKGLVFSKEAINLNVLGDRSLTQCYRSISYLNENFFFTTVA